MFLRVCEMDSLAMGTQYTHQGEAIVPQTLILQDMNFIYMVHKEKGTIDSQKNRGDEDMEIKRYVATVKMRGEYESMWPLCN